MNSQSSAKKTRLKNDQLELSVFEVQSLFPLIRQETIHKVKGERINAVLALCSTKFWDSIVEAIENGKDTEKRPLAYVAMIRARHLLLVGLPASHFDYILRSG